MSEATTRDNDIIDYGDIPSSIRQAVQKAGKCRRCTLLGELIKVSDTEYTIDALIGPESYPLEESKPPSYTVRFLIDASFPNKPVETIPLEPDLKWFPHQNGDWLRLGLRANIICPPRLSNISLDNTLLPYIDHAYNWISDALQGTLVKPEERYEFPYLLATSANDIIVYVEGGKEVYDQVKSHQYGLGLVKSIAPAGSRKKEILRVCSMRFQGIKEFHTSSVRPGVFGVDGEDGVVPWVFVGNPTIKKPHKPPVVWTDFPKHIRRRILNAIRWASSIDDGIIPIILIAFAIPIQWQGKPEAIVWWGLELKDFNSTAFENKPRKGGFHSNKIEKWPGVQRFIASNKDLQWIECRDVSEEAIISRGGNKLETIQDLRVLLLGVGAIGSMLGRSLSKIHPVDLLMVDLDSIEPGNIVRHEASPFYTERKKALSLAFEFEPIFATSTVTGLWEDVIGGWDRVRERAVDKNLVIDATGSYGVHELVGNRPELEEKAVAWCYVKPGPDFGVLVLRRPGSTLRLAQAEEQLYEKLNADLWADFTSDENADQDLIWPEPGCYHPTFAAPYHRLRMMTDAFLTTLLSWWGASCKEDVITLFRQVERDRGYGYENIIEAQIIEDD